MGFQAIQQQICHISRVTDLTVLHHALGHREAETLEHPLFLSVFFNLRHPKSGGIYLNADKSSH